MNHDAEALFDAEDPLSGVAADGEIVPANPVFQFPLTADQKNAWEFIDRSLFRSPDIHVAALLGHAGTGKSWLAGELVNYYRRMAHWDLTKPYRLANGDVVTDLTYSVVACAAPTNKAVRVLRELSPAGVDHNEAVWFGTLHSFLGLRMRLDEETGDESFEPDPNVRPRTAHLLLIDEASMISQPLKQRVDELLRKHHDLKILWVGDPAQLPPVNEMFSSALLRDNVTVMREIVRHGGAIQSCVNEMRDAVENPYAGIPRLVTNVKDEEGVYACTRDEFMAAMMADFRDQRFNEDADFARGVAWTNKGVDAMNATVHRELYGATADRFMPGQVLTAYGPVAHPILMRSLLMTTSDECRVTGATLLPGTARSGEAAFWGLNVDVNGTGYDLQVIEPADRVKHQKFLESLKTTAIRTPVKERSAAWRNYYQHRELFADLRPSYWLTVHKSQGSSFKRVYVATPDIFRNPNINERKRMFYTAYTRAVERLYALG